MPIPVPTPMTTMRDDALPRGQRAMNSIKTVRYETDTQVGVPPRTTFTSRVADDGGQSPPQTSRSDSSLPSVVAAVDGNGNNILVSELKRDSGIAPSPVSTVGSASFVGGKGVARQPHLPTIIVQDEDSPAGALDERSRSPSQPRSHNNTNHEKPRRLTRSSSPPRAQRKMSLSDTQSDVPSVTASASVDNINLTDLTSDKVTFSTRGSLLFGGKRMHELISAKGREVDRARTDGTSPPAPLAGSNVVATSMQEKSLQEGAEPLEGQTQPDSQTPQAPQEVPHQDEKPRQGLVAGRRMPNVHMLQAALQGGRVLSAEEITFSMKVRSMYDHGDEQAADWTNSLDAALSRKTTPDLSGRGTNTPDTMNGDVSVRKIRRPTSRKSSINADPRASFYSKEANEVAGGMEDWDEVDSRQVDRYGFIHPDRPVSRVSDSSTTQHHGVGMQRVATSLRVEAEQPRRDRKLKRGPSSIRSSRSMPPELSNGTIKRGPPSVHSAHSTSSRTSNPFRSRNRRALAEASDMLTVPPGLADIDEDEDAGTTASSLKQREWSREQKWQKMAKPIQYRTAGKGGGMRFEFDTTDPKLIERTWKGIPDRWRATAWHSFLSTSAKKRNSPATDEELIGQFHKLQGIASPDDVQIDVDVPRTINMHVMFRRRYRGGQRLLFRVLHAVSLYFPETGYVQGMAALAVTLLCYFEEELAFVMIVRLWQLRGLDQLFQSGFGGLLTCLKEFETKWLRGGEVAKMLEELGIDSTAWGTRWYLTLFNMSVPFPAQLRVWDVFMLLGDASPSSPGDFGGADLDVLHATSAALIDATREILLDSDFENAMKVLTSFVPIRDEDLLMRVAKAEWTMKKKRDGVKT